MQKPLSLFGVADNFLPQGQLLVLGQGQRMGLFRMVVDSLLHAAGDPGLPGQDIRCLPGSLTLGLGIKMIAVHKVPAQPVVDSYQAGSLGQGGKEVGFMESGEFRHGWSVYAMCIGFQVKRSTERLVRTLTVHYSGYKAHQGGRYVHRKAWQKGKNRHPDQ